MVEVTKQTKEPKLKQDSEIGQAIPDTTGSDKNIDDEKLFDYLNNEYGQDEDHVPYDPDEDTKGGFVNEDGLYHCLITEFKSQKVTRVKATKTRAIGSVFFWLKPTLKAVEQLLDDSKTVKCGGNIWPSIRYEKGDMLSFDKFCVATRCKAFNDGNVRNFFPKAPHDKGGALGMPVTVKIEMVKKDKMFKSDVDGEWHKSVDEHGNTQKMSFANVLAYYPWDTDLRFEPEDDVPDVPDINMESEEDNF